MFDSISFSFCTFRENLDAGSPFGANVFMFKKISNFSFVLYFSIEKKYSLTFLKIFSYFSSPVSLRRRSLNNFELQFLIFI